MGRTPESELFHPGGEPVGVFLSPPLSEPYRPRWWLHILLFVATLLSTSVIGGMWWVPLPAEMVELTLWQIVLDPRLFFAGLTFSVPLLSILFAHEMGHYLACRRHGLQATPPFFLPLPIPLFPIGTLGAVIRIKEPVRNRRQLLDVGTAGPLAGFAVAAPLLAVGILLSDVSTIPDEAGYFEFAEPVVYLVLEKLMVHDVSPDSALFLHPVGMAAWFGIFVTLLNLLPFAQLDGGHIMYALLGRAQHSIAWPLLGVFVALGFWWPGWWLWVVIALVMGPRHPPTFNEHLGLDPGRLDCTRIVVGWLTMAVFLLCFMVEPIRVVLPP